MKLSFQKPAAVLISMAFLCTFFVCNLAIGKPFESLEECNAIVAEHFSKTEAVTLDLTGSQAKLLADEFWKKLLTKKMNFENEELNQAFHHYVPAYAAATKLKFQIMVLEETTLPELFYLISLTSVGKKIIKDFYNAIHEKVSIRFVDELCASAGSDKKTGDIYLFKNGPLLIILPALLHELRHSTDMETHVLTDDEENDYQYTRGCIEKEHRAYRSENIFVDQFSRLVTDFRKEYDLAQETIFEYAVNDQESFKRRMSEEIYGYKNEHIEKYFKYRKWEDIQ